MAELFMFNKNFDHLKVDAFYSEKWNTYIMQPHSHFQVEFMQVLMGHATVNIFDDNLVLTKQYKLNCGDIIYLSPNVIHQLYIENEKFCHILNLELSNNSKTTFDTTIIKNKEFDFFINRNELHISFLDKYGTLGTYFSNLTKELEISRKNSNFSSYEIPLLSIFLCEFFREYYINFSTEFSQFDYIHSINKFIEENFMEYISIDDIANHVCLNKSYMQKLYKNQTGETVGDFLTKKRLQRACMLIENTNMSFQDIAFDVGYKSRQGFFKAFKQCYKTSPKEYKEKPKSDYS